MGTPLGCAIVFLVVVARLVGSRVSFGEGGQRLYVREPRWIADLGHKLRPQIKYTLMYKLCFPN